MIKPELGGKRRCLTCSTPFYDLNRNPIVCPKCAAVFEVIEVVRSTSRYARPRPPAFNSRPIAETFPADTVLLDDETEDAESAGEPDVQEDEDEKVETSA